MKIPHRKKDLFLPLIFLASIVLSCICIATHLSPVGTLLSNGFAFITTPLSSATRSVSSGISSCFDYFGDIDDLRKENKELKMENLLLRDENKDTGIVMEENESLRSFLGLKQERVDFSFVDTKIISRSNSNYIRIFSIDKGSFHGIKENMPVITADGSLIGITYSVDANSAKCKSVLSYDINVGVYSPESGETGILSGSLLTFADSKCVVSGLMDDTSIKEGDEIRTSGLGEIYPRDLKIGTVDSYIKDAGSQTKSAVITLNETVLEDTNVMVLTGFNRVYS